MSVLTEIGLPRAELEKEGMALSYRTTSLSVLGL